MEHFGEIDLSKALLMILQPKTVRALALRLDAYKVLLTVDGDYRDWRGLARKAQIDIAQIKQISSSHTERLINLWAKQKGTIKDLILSLQSIDRHDIIDDLQSFINADITTSGICHENDMVVVLPVKDDIDSQILTHDDIKNLSVGESVQRYDALVLHSDDEDDQCFVNELVSKLEDEYRFKLCLKDRDIIVGPPELDVMTRIIHERCNRVIVVLSESFLQSFMNEYLTTFTQTTGITKGQRFLIPCIYKRCKLPPAIANYSTVDYTRCGKYFWEKLRASIVVVHSRPVNNVRAIEEVPTDTSVNDKKLSTLTTHDDSSLHQTSISSPSVSVDEGYEGVSGSYSYDSLNNCPSVITDGDSSPKQNIINNAITKVMRKIKRKKAALCT